MKTMKTVKTIGRLALLALCLGPLVSAPSQAATDAATAELLMHKSGLWRQLDGLVPQVRAGLSSAMERGGAARRTSEERVHLNAIVEAAYAADPLRATARRVLAADLEAPQVPALLAWYASPLGAKFTQLEEAASASATDQGAVLREGAALLAKATPARQALIGQMVEATAAGEAITAMVINTGLAIQAGASGVRPESDSADWIEMKAALEQQRPQMLEAFSRLSLGLFARMYEAASDAELKRYLQFLKTPAGRKFTAAGTHAITTVFVEAAVALGQGLAAPRDVAPV